MTFWRWALLLMFLVAFGSFSLTVLDALMSRWMDKRHAAALRGLSQKVWDEYGDE